MSTMLSSDILSNEEKINIIKNTLIDNKSLTTIEDITKVFGTKLDISKLDEIVNILKFDVSELDLNKQDDYYQILDKIIDGVVSIRYDKTKKDVVYSDIVSINDDMLNCFKKLTGSKNDIEIFEELVTKIHLFTGKTMDLQFIVDNIKEYYEIYKKEGIVTLIDTSYFCNVILNHHRNYYMSSEKKNIIESLPSKLKMSKKKINSIKNNKKIEIITSLIASSNYEQLGVTEEEFNTIIDDGLKLDVDKNLKKADIVLSDDIVNKLKEEFKKVGFITSNTIQSITDIEDIEMCEYISRKFTRIKAKFLKQVKVDYKQEDLIDFKSRLPLNTTNFVIGDKDTLLNNISKLLLLLNDEICDDILFNKEYLNDIRYVLLFADLIDELGVDTSIKIFSNFSKIANKLCVTEKDKENEIEILLNKMSSVINLANGYASIDDILLYSIGVDVIERLGENVCINYKNIYKAMLNKHTGSIPEVRFTYNNRYYESGNYGDPYRLLLGKMYEISCIDLDNPGESTYRECLEKNTGDAIIVRDETGKVVDRLLLIRRGNIVQIIMKATHKFPLELYTEIGNQIINKAKEIDDNIDYVVVASTAIIDNQETIKITDSRFITSFPHADLEEEVSIVGAKNEVNSININFESSIKGLYTNTRKEISHDSSDYEITRLRALRIFLEENPILKEEMARNFEVFDRNNYKEVINGQDWYLALNDDNDEELVLPNDDSRKDEEINSVKQYIKRM